MRDMTTTVDVGIQLAVAGIPGSGSPAETMDAAGITAPYIVAAARRLLGTT